MTERKHRKQINGDYWEHLNINCGKCRCRLMFVEWGGSYLFYRCEQCGCEISLTRRLQMEFNYLETFVNETIAAQRAALGKEEKNGKEM